MLKSNLILFLLFLSIFMNLSWDMGDLSSIGSKSGRIVETYKASGGTFLKVKYVLPDVFIDEAYFQYVPSEGSTGVTENYESGAKMNTYKDDGIYHTYRLVIDPDQISGTDNYWYIHYYFAIPVKYLGTAALNFRARMARSGLSTLNYEKTTTKTLTNDYIINDFVYFEVKGKYYYFRYLWGGSVAEDRYEIWLYCYVTKSDGTKEQFYSFDSGLIEDDDSDHFHQPTSLYLDIDLVKCSGILYYGNIPVEDKVTGDAVYHMVSLSVPSVGTKVYFLNLLEDWVFYNSSPVITFNDEEDYFEAVIVGDYQLIFVTYDPWNYDEYRLSRVAYHTSRGETLPFDSFHTYYAESPSRLIQYVPDVNDPDLVAWFRFNEGAGTTTTDWKNDLEGTINGGATWTTGYIGKALQFDGVDDYVEVYSALLNDIGSALTLECWFKRFSSLTTYDKLIVKPYFMTGWSYPNVQYNLGLYGSDGVEFNIAIGGTLYSLRVSGLIHDNEWYHLAGTYDGSKMRLYLNGKLVGKYAVSGSVDSRDSYLRFGNAVQFDQQFNGTIDEVRIYKRALTPEEIWWHYALVFYFDGFRDVMGREHSSINGEHEINRGVFGYATLLDKCSIGYDNDESLIEWRLRGGTDILYANVLELYDTSAWHKLIYIPYFRYEYNPSDEYIYIWWKTYAGTSWFGSNALFHSNEFQQYHFVIHTFSTSGYYFAFADGNWRPARTEIEASEGWYAGWGGITFDADREYKVLIDEFILIREPLSEDMVYNLYYMAKKYIGGYYTDESFKATWDIEQDSSEDGNGFSEDFSDISEWSLEFATGGGEVADYSFTTDGDVVTYYAEYTSSPGSAVVRYLVVLDDLNPSAYPFFEARWKGETNTSTDMIIAIRIKNSTDATFGPLWLADQQSSFDWTFLRINLQEFVRNQQESLGWSDAYIDRIYIMSNDRPDDQAQYCKIWIDWIRIYNFESYDVYTGSGVDTDDWIYSIGGDLVLHLSPEDDGLWDVIGLQRFFDWNENMYLEMRLKYFAYGGSTNFKVRAWVVDHYEYLIDTVFDSDDVNVWYTYRVPVSINGYYKVEILNHESYFSPGFSYGQELYIDYIRIGYLQEQVQDTEWYPMFDSVFEFPKYGYIWLNVTDIWGNQLIYQPYSYTPFIDITLSVYSWKFHNGLDDDFIHINITNGYFWHSEWLAPKETTEYILYPDTYTLKVTYTNGSYFVTNLEVSTDYYWMLEGNVLSDVLGNIAEVYNKVNEVGANLTNVNNTINSQILNVNLTITNWNSEINNTVVNVQINLDNVNSSLGELIINNSLFISNMYSVMNNSFLSMDVRLYNNFTEISGQILSVNSTVLNVNSTVNWQSNVIQTQITNVQTNLTTQFNWMFTNITNVNATLYAQTIAISTDISNMWSDMNISFMNLDVRLYNNFTKIDTFLVDMNNTIYVINATIDTMHNNLTVQITNLQTNITYQYNHILANITNINSTIQESLSYMRDDVKEVQYLTQSTAMSVGAAIRDTKYTREIMEKWLKVLIIVLSAVGFISIYGMLGKKKKARDEKVKKKTKHRITTVKDLREKYEKKKLKIKAKLRRRANV